MAAATKLDFCATCSGSRALSFSDPFVTSRGCLWVCGFVCLSATLRSNISETKEARGSVSNYWEPIGKLPGAIEW